MSSKLPTSPLLLLLLLHLTTSTPLFPPEAHPTKSGYLLVSSTTTTNSSLYYTYYESRTTPLHPQTPILIWLQGGPGCSSMVGNFYELGPFLLHRHHNKTQLHLTPNTNSWNRQFGLLFIDNPIGTGFSIASSPDQIPTSQSTVAQHLWVGIQQFLDTSPGWFRARPLFLTGESYAGKYVPSAGAHVMRKNEVVGEGRRINLKGVAIGNGLMHPVVQVESHAKMAFYAGLVNAAQRRSLEELQKVAVELTVAEKWAEATTARTRVLNWLQNATGLGTLFDLRRKTPYHTEIVGEFLKNEEVKAALGVSKEVVWKECSDIVRKSLHTDVMKSVKPMVDELLEKTRVLLYQGIFDLRDGVVSTEMWLEELKWEELDEFLKAQRKVWKVDGVHAGYVQKWKSFTQVVVDGAGHLVPTDQGRTSQAMIEGWVLQNGLFGDGNNMECGHGLWSPSSGEKMSILGSRILMQV